MTYSICETVTSVVTYLRVVGEEGLVYAGGLGKQALCGSKVSWDTRMPLRRENVRCRECLALLETQGDR